MSDHSGQQIVIWTTIWWWQKLGRLAVNKQGSHRFLVERFNLKKLMRQTAKRSIMLRSQTGLQLWKVWTLRLKLILTGKQLETIKLSAQGSLGYELTTHKPWFDEGFSKLLNQRKQVELLWLQVSSEIIHSAEPLVPGPSGLEVQTATVKLKSINLQAMIKFQQNRFMQEEKHWCL
jgi:hypothetical protein